MPVVRTDNEIELINETLTKTSLNNILLDDSSLNTENKLVCTICNKIFSVPRILSCFHVFCEECLEKLYNQSETSDDRGTIKCPTCQQVTKIVGTQGIKSLACDYLSMNMLELDVINSSSLLCTSCKNGEKAIARCVDCFNFLCSHCSVAHRVMRCFDKHLVISLEEIKDSKEKVPIHKPIRCNFHKQLVTHFCISCQEPVCTDCTFVEHKSPKHTCERIELVILKERQIIETMASEARKKLSAFQEFNLLLDTTLHDLQTKYDHNKQLINETYENYKAILESCRDEVLSDLTKIHSQLELKVMDAFHDINKKVERLSSAYNFTTRTLENGSEAEILSLKRFILSQLDKLVSDGYTKPDVNVPMEFVTSHDQFKYTVKVAFGYIRGMEKSTQGNVNGTNHDYVPSTVSGYSASAHSSSSPVNSSPLSVPSSFESDMNFINIPPRSTPPLEGLTGLAEINLARLASIVEKTEPIQIPAEPPLTLDLLASSDVQSNLINNIQALVQLGTGQLSDQDLISDGFNGIGSNFSVDNGVLEMVHDPSSVMNGNVPTYDTISAAAATATPYYNNSGLNNFDLINEMSGLEHQSYVHTYQRNNSQRVAPLEIHFKFGQLGANVTHFNSPHGFCITDDDSIVVADTNNHRIQIFTRDGEYANQFGVPGKMDGQLWYPRKVELLPTGRFVICDRGSERSRLQLFSRVGIFIKKIRLMHVDIVAGMTVTDDGEIVVVDSVQPTLYKLNENGEVSYWFNCSFHMTEPSDVAVKDNRCYICDFKGHTVAIFNHHGQLLTKIGRQGLTDYPNGIDILRNGNILVGDSHGNKFHICIFSREGTLLYEYECPYVKVSRCCGLKVTSEGYIITVAKNNNHVLVLNSPFPVPI